MNARTESHRLASPALYEQVAEKLRARIFAHQLAPGEWIDETELAEEFGISRTPLREALKVLAAEGLIQLKPRRGAYVAAVSEQDLDDVFPVIALLESHCAREATRKASDADLSRLRGLHAELEHCAAGGDADRFFEVNQAFHVALQDLAGNRWLKQLIDESRQFVKLIRRDSLNREGRLKQSLAEHRSLLEAILARDPEQAERLMRDHLLSGRAAVAKIKTSP
jgi:DNA-binding GntR family transcriptional regulator